jgi:ATP-dependent helicase/nuclease subunit A
MGDGGGRGVNGRPQLIAAQAAAADPAASVWVSASAGTGKTHVLTNRVLRLLLAGSPPERILCLTFTKAAAAEMSIRIAGTLGAWTALDDDRLTQALLQLTGEPPAAEDLARARRLFAEVLEAPGGLSVETIHAFCESLLGRFPLEARLAPHFQVMDERTADELLAAARERVLAADLARAAPLATALAALVDDERYAGLMKALAAERGRLARLIEAAGGIDGLVAGTRALWRLAEGEGEAEVLRAAADDAAFAGAVLRRVARAMLAGSAGDRERGQAIAEWLAHPAERPARFAAYCAAFLTQKWEPRARLLTKQALEAAADGVEVLAAEAARLIAVEARRRAVRIAEASEALLRLGAALVEVYAELKQARALVDYDDLIYRSRDLLRAPGVAPWVLYKLDGGIDHILVDEAQDTNPEQWQVIQALAGEFFAGAGAREQCRTVFAVGDPKQSIFSFQRAEPAAFERLREYFAAAVPAAGADWRPIELAVSFRSTPAVLSFVDRVFADEAARDGLLFGPGEIRHHCHREGQHGLVELWPTEAPEAREGARDYRPPLRQEPDDSPMGRLAARIVLQIRAWLDTGERLAARGRPIRPGDVLILLQRRRPFLDEMVRRLKQAGIPVSGADRMVLNEQMAVMDLLALGRFLLLPDDDLTLAVVLKGPLIGLDEAALFRLAHGRKRSLWRTLRARRAEAPEFEAAAARLEAWLGRVDFAAPFEFYASLLGVDGGRRQLLGRLGLEAGEAIDEFLDLALDYERAHPPSLQGFLAWIETGEAEVKRDLARGRDEVRVMTVHGAKGLEAPIVILADTVRRPAQVPDLLWRGEPAEPEALVWLPSVDLLEPVTEGLREAAILKRDQEYRRLLYVALTRAQDRLYIAGWETTRGRDPACWYDLALKAMRELGQELREADGRTAWRLETPQSAAPKTEAAPEAEPTAASPPAWFAMAAPSEPEPARPLAPSRPAPDEPTVSRPLGEDDGRRFRRGLLLHRLLQSLPELAPPARPAAARRYLGQAAAELPPDARSSLADEALAVLALPELAPLFGPGSRAEAPLVGRVGRRVVSGQVDRLAVLDDAVLLLDYKSNRPAPTRPEDCPPAYLAQMAAYRALLRQIYPDRPVKCALLWTETPSLMALDDASLDRHSP